MFDSVLAHVIWIPYDIVTITLALSDEPVTPFATLIFASLGFHKKSFKTKAWAPRKNPLYDLGIPDQDNRNSCY